MQNIILVNPAHAARLRPLSWTRPVAEFRVGILTLREKWERRTGAECSHLVQDDYLKELFPIKVAKLNWVIAGHLIANDYITSAIARLRPSQSLYARGQWIAACLRDDDFDGETFHWERTERIETDLPFHQIGYLNDIFQLNASAIREDYDLLTKGRQSQAPSNTNQVKGDEVFIEAGAKVECSVLNAEYGPIYIGSEAEIMEGCLIRGPFALGYRAQLKMGAKIYGATAVGPYSKVGGEVNNSIIFGNSNKAHDGFLGNSVIGEWCNLGADTNSSNLKNNYEEVKLWNYQSNRFEKTGTIFCGLMMGDHAKCGINTMFNTGTVVGVGANVFGAGYPRQFVPDFAWGGTSGFSTFHIAKFLETAAVVLSRRDQVLTEAAQRMLSAVYVLTQAYRTWEK